MKIPLPRSRIALRSYGLRPGLHGTFIYMKNLMNLALLLIRIGWRRHGPAECERLAAALPKG
jgi:hypothetical protein